jgi:ankyrin repeat protein
MKHVLMTVLSLAFGLAVGPVMAQVAPSPETVAGYEGLHQAAHLHNAAEVTRLAAEGADLNARDLWGRTPAHVAAFASADDALRALAAAGANLNLLEDDLYDVLTIAAVADDPKMVALAIELGNPADLITSRYEGTALIAAAHLGHAEVVEHLITGGAPLDHVNNLGWTALIEAVILGDGGPRHVATVKALVSAGADVSIGDSDGTTPLTHAENRGYQAIAALIRAGKGQ